MFNRNKHITLIALMTNIKYNTQSNIRFKRQKVNTEVKDQTNHAFSDQIENSYNYFIVYVKT